MKKLSAVLVIVIVFVLALPASADKVVTVFSGQDVPKSVAVDTTGYQTALVTIWAASGTPNGTVTIYSQPPLGAPPVALATYATPTTAKTFRGPVGASIVVSITGLSSGTISAVAVLK